MEKTYTLVIPDQEETEELLKRDGNVGCVRCVAVSDNDLCSKIASECVFHEYSYYKEVETDNK